MKRHDILKALRRIRKALFPGERYELIIHTPDGKIVKYVGCKVPVTPERKNVDELANRIKKSNAQCEIHSGEEFISIEREV